jgi:hypothetical protein
VTPSATHRTVHRLGPDGVVRDWLLTPVWEHPCTELGEIVTADGDPWDADGRLGRWRLTQGPDVAPVKDLLYARYPMPTPALPSSSTSEGAQLQWPAPFPGQPSPLEGAWARHHTAADGVVERSTFCYTPTYRCFLASTTLEVDQPEQRVLEVSSTGPVRVWVGGQLALDHAEFGYMQPWTRYLPVLLPSGSTEVVIASWNVALREVRQTLRLRVQGLPLRVVVPSPGADEARDAVAEQALDAIALRRWECTDGLVRLSGPPGARVRVAVGGMPGVRHTFDDTGTAVVTLTDRDSDTSQASMLGTGEVTLGVRLDDDACRSERRLLVGYLPWQVRQQPQDDPDTWRRELLEHVAGRGARAGSAAALARLALDPAGADLVVTEEVVSTALRFVRDRGDCADFEGVGLMLLWHRVREARWEPDVRKAVREALVGFKYWIDQPGIDAMCYFTENHQMVWHTAETLVGEAFSEERFSNSGWLGSQHAEHGRAMAQAWIERKLTDGFSEFDSNAYLAIDALALVSLADHAQHPTLRSKAEALLDVILLTLAANSWRGSHGSAHGRSYTPTLRASCLEETAPIMWWGWGMGALNEACLPATALATATAYRLPPVVRAIGGDPDADWSATQSYSGDYGFERDLLERPYGSTVVVRRGRGGMVSSVQDYRSGLPGLQEHVWGITLPRSVQIWATNPAAANHGSHTRPCAWVGHRVLPRVRQHDRTVVAVHDPAAGPVHLWFPVDRLDEWRRDGDWLVGRSGDGYAGVAVHGGWHPDPAGDEAWQRWTPGDGHTVVAVHGHRGDHANLDAFRAALPTVDFSGGHATVTQTGGGPVLELGWNGPFLVEGAPVDLADGVPVTPPHLDNPACHLPAGQGKLAVRWGGEQLEVDIASGTRLSPPSTVSAHGVESASDAR